MIFRFWKKTIGICQASKLKKGQEKNIEILILPYNQSNGLYKRDSSTESVNISDVITAVNLVKEREGF